MTRRHLPLQPSLEMIESRLFGVTPGLIDAVKDGKTSPRIAEAVKATPEWADFHQAETEPDRLEPNETTPTPMPEHLRDLIAQRVKASQAKFSRTPMEGQIVEVTRIVTPEEGQLDWEMTVPFYVLLDRPAESDDLWSGWFVSAEVDYASSWDFVLQEQDEPFDPEAGMVQAWNPVRIYLPMIGRVVAELRPERLTALRALAVEFLLSEDETAVARPGHVEVRETYGGYEVVTGTPKGGVDDPRHKYQNMYHYAAEAIREPAALALASASALEQTISTANAAHDALIQLNPLRGDCQAVIERQDAISDALQDSEWFRKANWALLSSRHIKFESSLIPDHHIQLELFWRGNPLLTQTYGEEPVDWSIRIGDTTVDFQDGLSEISKEQLHAIASQAGLPDIYTNWDRSVRLRTTLGQAGTFLDQTQRNFVRMFLNAAKIAGESLSDVLESLSLIPSLHTVNVSRSAGGGINTDEKLPPPEVEPIVVAVKQLAPKKFLLTLCWVGQAPKEIMWVGAQVFDGGLSEISFTWNWQDKGYTLLEIRGLDLMENFKTRASWIQNSKGLSLEFESSSSDLDDWPTLQQDLQAWEESHKSPSKS